MIPSFESRHARGGRACPAFGGGSESSSSTQQVDRRNAVGNGGFGITGDGSSINSTSNTYIQSVDREIVSRALDSVDISSAENRQGFESLLEQSGGMFEKLVDTGREMFNTTQGLIGQTQQSVADAYSMAQTDAKGTIDNRTIIVLALAGVAVVVLMAQRKG